MRIPDAPEVVVDTAALHTPAAVPVRRRGLERAKRFLFGDDVFISYARADATNYALKLANELTKREISCFLDQWGTPPGDRLPEPLLQALRRSTMLVLLGTERAAGSAAVRREVNEFIRTGRPLIPISFGGALERAEWFPLIRGLSLAAESEEARAGGRPSEAVLSRIVNAEGFTRRSKRLRRAFWSTTILIGALAITGSLTLAHQSRLVAEATTVRDAALAQADTARNARSVAEQERQRAESLAVQAEQQRAEADSLRGLARAEAALARDAEAAARGSAEEQRRIAQALNLANQATSAFDETGDGLVRSLLLAVESLKLAWTREGYAAWARAVALAPRRPETWLDVDGTAVVDLHPHPHKPWLAMAGADGAVRIVDLDSGTTLRTLPLSNNRLQPPAVWPGAIVRFSPDGRWLAAAGMNRLSIWQTTGWERRDINLNTAGYFDLAFDRTGRLLAFGGYAQPLRLFETDPWRELLRDEARARTYLRAIGFTATHLVAAYRSGEVVFWEIGSDPPALREAFRVEPTQAGDNLHAVAIAQGDDALALVTERSGLRSWTAAAAPSAPDSATQDPQPEGTARRPATQYEPSWSAQAAPVHGVTFGPDDAYLLTSAATGGNSGQRFDPAVRLWDAGRGRELARIFPGGPAAFVRQGRFLAVGGPHPALWALPTRGTATSLAFASPVRSVAFSPDGRWLVAGLENGTLEVRRSGSWSDPVVLRLSGPVQSLGFTADGRWLIAGSTDRDTSTATLHLFRTGTWQPAPPRQHEDVFTIHLSPDGRHVRTHTREWEDRYDGLRRASRTRIWRLPTAEEVAWRSHEREDGSRTGKISIAEGTLPLGQAGDATLLEQAAGWPELRPLLSVFTHGINFARPSTDGRWLAGFGGRNASEGLALLESATGRRLVTLRPGEAPVTDLDFSPDGHWLASAEGNAVDLWLLGPVEALIEEACTRLGRNLTAEEWGVFIAGEPRPTCNRLRLPDRRMLLRK